MQILQGTSRTLQTSQLCDGSSVYIPPVGVLRYDTKRGLSRSRIENGEQRLMDLDQDLMHNEEKASQRGSTVD
jgi:hypothetical protein